MEAGNGGFGFNNNMNQIPNFWNIMMNWQIAVQNNIRQMNMMLMNVLNNMSLEMIRQQQANNIKKNNFNSVGVQGSNRMVPTNKSLPKNTQMNCNPFPNSNAKKINITFDSSGNFKLIMIVPVDTKMKDVLKAFIKKTGLRQDAIGKLVNFIYGGQYISPNEERTVSEFGIRTDFCSILVVDISNLLGG